jgi:hypothetical protein
MSADDHETPPSDGDWAPGPHAVRFDQTDTTRIVLHGTTPFVAEIGDGEVLDKALRRVGHDYLDKLDRTVEGGLGLPEGWLDALDPDGAGRPPLRWLDIWDGAGEPPRLASWRLIRHATPDEDEEVIVLVAAEEIDLPDREQAVGLGFGLRVPMTVRQRTVTVRSMTAELPYPPYRSLTELIKITGKSLPALVDPTGRIRAFSEPLDLSIKTHDETLGRNLQLDNLVYDDLRLRWRDVDGETKFEAMELLGKGLSVLPHHPEPLPYGFTADFVLEEVDGQPEFVLASARKHLLASHAGYAEEAYIDVCVFDPEPPTPGPVSAWQTTRTEKELREFRKKCLTIPRRLETDDFKVRNCPSFVPGDPDNDYPKEVTRPADEPLPVRSNDFSAVSAFVNCKGFFEVVGGFGIPLNDFVVAAERQIQVFYRSGMGTKDPRKNGDTVNARVVIRPAKKEEVPRFRNAPLRPTIEMHLALGNLSHRGRWIDGISTPVRAEPLGIAASGRWMWHEFGHVLVAARLGQLEFDFAHSPGDGMAAVMADPFSPFADPRDETRRRFRGITFPWVFATRRHDRSATLGWAWGGALNRSLLAAPARQRAKPKGYLTEQILSSTLFRLYRVLGGDTVWADGAPNYALRERASFVTLYLLIQAVRSMAQPPSVAEMLEAAMEGADTDMAAPLPFAPLSVLPPPASGIADAWIGGLAHKAVRWAFEAQGMFAPDSLVDHNGPGRPLPVDVYIPDRRPRGDAAAGGLHHPGSYAPVSLDWDGERLWQADPAAILARVPLTVGLRNRGDEGAVAVRLRAWWGEASGDPAAPGWDMEDAITWERIPTGSTDPGVTVPPGAGVDAVAEIGEVDDSPAATGTFRLLLVEVSCPADRANSDPAAMLPTAIADDKNPPTVPRHLADLVANDNNLALWQF